MTDSIKKKRIEKKKKKKFQMFTLTLFFMFQLMSSSMVYNYYMFSFIIKASVMYCLTLIMSPEGGTYSFCSC